MTNSASDGVCRSLSHVSMSLSLSLSFCLSLLSFYLSLSIAFFLSFTIPYNNPYNNPYPNAYLYPNPNTKPNPYPNAGSYPLFKTSFSLALLLSVPNDSEFHWERLNSNALMRKNGKREDTNHTRLTQKRLP